MLVGIDAVASDLKFSRLTITAGGRFLEFLVLAKYRAPLAGTGGHAS